MKNYIKKRIDEQQKIINDFINDDSLINEIGIVSDVIVKSLKSGGKLLLCGNGGSAADAQHLATELVSRFLKDRKALTAIALTTNTSSLTAIGNDYSFDQIFARQVEALGRKGDVLLGISTSGNSKNIAKAFEMAKEMDIQTVGFTGNNRNALIAGMADHCIFVPSSSTPRIQEVHIILGHIICEYVEEEIFK